MHTLAEKDFARDSETTLQESYRRFQSLLLAHSVDRSPQSVQVFHVDQVAAIVDFVAHTYFRHFNLHKCVFTPFEELHIVQRAPNDVESPLLPRPLADGFLHTTPALPSEPEAPTPSQ
ncbi:hypothetical protein PINS_up014442 [Pythium insidiosum]|nr:hypothetical protein PINS_up014442 [Pythium insidiosum]